MCNKILLISFLLLGLTHVSFAETEQAVANAIPKKVIVYSTSEADRIYLNKEGLIQGPWARKIESLMNKAGLDYQILIAPWSRVYNASLTRDNTLITNLDRTKARENKFHWLLPIQSRTDSLMALSSSQFIGMTIKEIVESDATAVCNKWSSQCDLLRDIGFKNEKILQVNLMEQKDIHQVLINGRPDFYIYDVEIYKADMAEKGLDADQMTVIANINTVTSYIATSVKTDPLIVKQLLKAVENTTTEVDLYVDPYFFILWNNAKYEEGREELRELINLFGKLSIKHKIISLPWNRAIREASLSDNALIFSIIRTQAREKNYHWIFPVKREDPEVFIYSRKGFFKQKPQKEKILEKQYTVACELGSAECDLLADFGFKDNQILRVAALENPSQALGLLFRNRVDFVIGPKAIMLGKLDLINEPYSKISPIASIGFSPLYIAAPKMLDPLLLKKLTQQN